MRFILRILINTLAIFAVAYLVPGFEVSGFLAALIMAVILGIINALIRPLVILLTLPVNILTLGLFTFIINALMFWLASVFVIGVSVADFAAAFWGAIIVWIVSWLTNVILRDKED